MVFLTGSVFRLPLWERCAAVALFTQTHGHNLPQTRTRSPQTLDASCTPPIENRHEAPMGRYRVGRMHHRCRNCVANRAPWHCLASSDGAGCHHVLLCRQPAPSGMSSGARGPVATVPSRQIHGVGHSTDGSGQLQQRRVSPSGHSRARSIFWHKSRRATSAHQTCSPHRCSPLTIDGLRPW